LPLNGVVCATGGDVGKGVIVELGFEVG
jgi:hypothetical protein